jgi:hypothetical protein
MPTKISFKLSAGDAVVGGFAIAALLREYPDMQLQIGSQVPYLWKYNRNCIATLS